MKKRAIFFATAVIAVMTVSGLSARVWTKSELIADAKKSIKTLSVQEAKSLVDSGKAVLIDVRGLSIDKEGKKVIDERKIDGYIKGALHIPRGQLEFRTMLLTKNKTYILFCRSGERSALSTKTLKEMGYNVLNMNGGFLAWSKAGYPILK